MNLTPVLLLHLYATVGAGALKSFNVGGIANRWEYLVAGTPLQQIERCADLAQPGDVLITPEALDVGNVQDFLAVELVTPPAQDATVPGGVTGVSGVRRHTRRYSFSRMASLGAAWIGSPKRTGSGGKAEKKSLSIIPVGGFGLGHTPPASSSFLSSTSSSPTTPTLPSANTSPAGSNSLGRALLGAVSLYPFRITGLLNDANTPADEVIHLTPLMRPEAILKIGPYAVGKQVDAGSNDVNENETDAVIYKKAAGEAAEGGKLVSKWSGDRQEEEDEEDEEERKRSELLMTALGRYIPKAAQASMNVGSGSVGRSHQWLGEIRLCSIVFVNFTGIDYTGADAVQHVQEAMKIMQTVILQYEGSLRQFLVEDKGSTLIAAFGRGACIPLTERDFME